MFNIIRNSLATLGGVVIIPTMFVVVDCSLAYYMNTPEDLKKGVKCPMSGVVFTTNVDK